jgi:hypothetical protein
MMAQLQQRMEAQTEQPRSFLADEVQKQTQQLQISLADIQKGVGFAKVPRGSAPEVDELRSVVRVDVQEVVRTELRAAMAPSRDPGSVDPSLAVRRVSTDTGLQARARHADLPDLRAAPSPRRASVKTPSLNAQTNIESPRFPLISDKPSRSPSKQKLSGELGYALLETERRTTFLELARSYYPRMGDLFKTPIEKLDDLWDAEEPPRSGALAICVASSTFQSVFSAVIMANAWLMTYSVNQDLRSVDNGGAEKPAWMSQLEMSFLFLYIIELLCKLGVHRLFYFWNEDMAWNWLDFLLILQNLLECLIGGGGGNTWMRTLRLFRVAKVLRILRVVKFFTQLHLILAAIIGSVMHLFWSILVFAILFYLFSLYIASNVATCLHDLESVDGNEAKDMLLHYGSVPLCMRTLFMTVSGGSDWDAFYFALEPTSMAQSAFLFFVAFSQVALLNIFSLPSVVVSSGSSRFR